MSLYLYGLGEFRPAHTFLCTPLTKSFDTSTYHHGRSNDRVKRPQSSSPEATQDVGCNERGQEQAGVSQLANRFVGRHSLRGQPYVSRLHRYLKD